MEWSLCVICQRNTGEPLRCPLDSLNAESSHASYEAFLQNASKFKELNELPIDLQFRADEENVESFVRNRAVWHKTCYVKFSNTKLERAEARKRKQTQDAQHNESSRVKRKKISKNVCIFCEMDSDNLHEVTTLEVDKNVRMIATELQDLDLLAKIAEGDMIAIEAKYHLKCMVSLRNRYRSHLRKSAAFDSNVSEEIVEARAFAELISYMETASERGGNIFKLSDLHNLYVKRLHDLNIDKTVNKTRLKQRILSQFLDELQEQTDGKNTLLVFNENIKSLLKESLTSRDVLKETLDLTRVVKAIRKDMFELEGFQFSGSFPPRCQQTSVPPTLLCLVSMMLNGTNIDDQEEEVSQACLTIAQLILFNSKKKSSNVHVKNTRSCLNREPPLPLYVGLSIHTQTRSKKIVNKLSQLGLSVSYNRVESLTNGIATALCSKFRSEGIVCPLNMKSGVFTVGALDNIDHNPSSTTAQGSFHGTGISIFQFPTEYSDDGPRQAITLVKDGAPRDLTLPESFSIVPAINFQTTDVQVNSIETGTEDEKNEVAGALAEENCWAHHSLQLLKKDLVNDDYISWAAYHASLESSVRETTVISGLLPFFYEKAATISMVSHGMNVIQHVTQYLNPGQIPIITLDQPLYAIAKYCQWKWPVSRGEKMYVVMLGGLHIEMALWNICGDLLEDSGWTTVIADSGVASAGTADSFLKVSHLTRTRHAHQVTALALANLQQEAFSLSNPECQDLDEEAFRTWKTAMVQKSPTFQFWELILQLERLILIFVRSHRQKKNSSIC